MKILIFTTAYLPFVGGAELAIKEITGRIPEASFTLITARFRRALPKHERIGNVEVYRVGIGFSGDKWLLPFLGFRLAKRLTLKHEPFNTIWSVMASQASIAAARFKKAFPHQKLVLTLQEGDEENHLRRYAFGNAFLYRLLIRPWHLLVFKRADAITAISNYLAERAQANAPQTPVTVIPNGVDIKNFQLSISHFQKEEIREKLGIQKEDKVIITTSRLVEKNGVEDLIESLRYLPNGVKLIICGSGSLERSLKSKVESLQLKERVKFLGHVVHEDLPEYLHCADIFARPSRSEGMGSSFVEAMAAELPVVTTAVGGIPDFLSAPLPGSAEEQSLFAHSHELENRWGERINGLFCKVGNPEDIAEKIRLLLSDDNLRNRITQNAATMVRERYDWDSIAEEMRKVFNAP